MNVAYTRNRTRALDLQAAARTVASGHDRLRVHSVALEDPLDVEDESLRIGRARTCRRQV